MGNLPTTYMLHMSEELGIVMRPIRSSHQHDDLDDFVTYEGSHRGVVADEMLHEEIAKLRPLSEVNGQPHLSHKILQKEVSQFRIFQASPTTSCSCS